MKKRNLFIAIGILIISALSLFLYYVDSNSTKIDEKHINLVFNIENISISNHNELKTQILQPLLKSSFYTENKEVLFIPKVVHNNKSFCIPAFGLNSLRYNPSEQSLEYYNKDSRLLDEEYFFSEWKMDRDLNNFLKAFNSTKINSNINLYNDIHKQKTNLFIDSFIINSRIIENSNFEFKNTSELRAFLDKEIEKFKIKNKINIYIFFMDGAQIKSEPSIIIDEIEDEIPPKPPVITDKIEETPPLTIKKPEQTSQKISISHSNSAGKFIVAGINNINNYHVYMKIQQTTKGKGRGAVVLHDFKEITCPNKSESNKILGMLADPVDLTITVFVEDQNGNLITSNIYKSLSLICKTDKSCGFIDLDKISNN